jgi:hypothetical protein
VCCLSTSSCSESSGFDPEYEDADYFSLTDIEHEELSFEDLSPFSDTLISNPNNPFPPYLSQVGIYPEAPDLTRVSSQAVLYGPIWPLWTNGSDKWRYIVLPDAEVIDNSDPENWQFPVGTLLFKTFTYSDLTVPGGWRAVETRIMRVTDEGMEFALYQWDENGLDAVLLDMLMPVSLEVTTAEYGTIPYTLPNLLLCRVCHESSVSQIIGFSELQLNGPLNEDEPHYQIDHLEEQGIFLNPISENPAAVVAENELTHEVMGYVHGNCVHCHNGTNGPSSSYDLSYPVFIDSTVGHATESSASAPGIRVVPQSPEESILFLAFSGETDNSEVKDMPPAGVDVRDQEAIELFREWIMGLDEIE